MLAFFARWWSFSVTFGLTWNVFWMYFNALGNNTNVEMHFSFVYIHCFLGFKFKTRHSAKGRCHVQYSSDWLRTDKLTGRIYNTAWSNRARSNRPDLMDSPFVHSVYFYHTEFKYYNVLQNKLTVKNSRLRCPFAAIYDLCLSSFVCWQLIGTDTQIWVLETRMQVTFLTPGILAPFWRHYVREVKHSAGKYNCSALTSPWLIS